MNEPAPGTTSSVRPDLSGALEHRRIAVLAALLGPVLREQRDAALPPLG